MHIICRPTKTSKGLVVCTHKEYPFLRKHGIDIELSSDYMMILHVGGFTRIPWRWFLVNRTIQLVLLPQSRKGIPFWVSRSDFCTRRFTPRWFHSESDVKRDYDIIVVSRIAPIKETMSALDFLSTLKSKRALVIGGTDNKDDFYYKEFKARLESLSNVDFIDVTELKNPKGWGLDAMTISEFYRRAKVYLHTCPVEGESRTIHEALLSGCSILVPKSMKGGGLDYYDSARYTLYEPHCFSSSFCEALEKFDKPLDNALIRYNELRDVHSRYRFQKMIHSKIPETMGMAAVWDLADLNLKLPAHFLDVPWYRSGKPTADILTFEQYDSFRSDALG